MKLAKIMLDDKIKLSKKEISNKYSEYWRKVWEELSEEFQETGRRIRVVIEKENEDGDASLEIFDCFGNYTKNTGIYRNVKEANMIFDLELFFVET